MKSNKRDIAYRKGRDLLEKISQAIARFIKFSGQRVGDNDELPEWAKAMKNDRHSADDIHRSKERTHWNLQLWSQSLNTVIALGALAGAFASAYFTYEQAEVSRRTLVDIQRAFMIVSELSQREIEAGNAQAGQEFVPVIKNSGATAAFDVRIAIADPMSEHITLTSPEEKYENWHEKTTNYSKYVSYSFKIQAPMDPDNYFKFKSSLSQQLHIVKGISLPPQGPFINPKLSFKVNAGNYRNMISNNIGRFIYGSVHYKDIFDRKDHVTKYCYMMDRTVVAGNMVIEGLQSPVGIIGDFKVEPRLCSHWNCVDDYCIEDKLKYEKELAEAQGQADSDQAIGSPLNTEPPRRSPVFRY